MSLEKLTKELQTIKGKRATIAPSMVVDFAQDHRESEIYRRFDEAGLWDDSTAAEAARLAFGRQLIHLVKVHIIGATGERHRVRAYVSLREDRDGNPSYRLRVDVLSNEERLDKLRRDFRRDLEGLLKRYADLLTHDMWETFEAMAARITMGAAAGGELMETAAAADK